jgi:hypothetical protein
MAEDRPVTGRGVFAEVVGVALRVFIIMTSFTDRYHDILYT